MNRNRGRHSGVGKPRCNGEAGSGKRRWVDQAPKGAKPRAGSHESLLRLAKLHGIQTSYLDMAGVRRAADPETLRGILKSFTLGVESDQSIENALRVRLEEKMGRGMPPVVVAWQGQKKSAAIRLTREEAGRPVHLSLDLEGGGVVEISQRLPKGRFTNGTKTGEFMVPLPKMAPGYHELRIQTREQTYRSLVISSPQQSYSPGKSTRALGLFLPMYAAHSSRSWGAGNYGDFGTLVDWAGERGIKVVGTLPLCPTFLERGKCEPSPYSPISRCFWNEFYLEIERLPEFADCERAHRKLKSRKFREALEELRSQPLVDYARQAELQRQILRYLAQDFFSKNHSRRAILEKYRAAHPRLDAYAEFRATMQRQGKSWSTWPRRLAEGRIKRGDFLESDKQFHLYCQWAAAQQVDALLTLSKRRGVEFYLDLPVGVHPDGFDVWREKSSFALGASVGAPPDICFPRGQDWGFPPMHTQRIREDNYRYIRDFLGFQMRHTGLLRIDHVMGLHRLYWIPRGFPASRGAYVRYHAEELHAIVNLESHRHQTVVVGENLGTVPPEVNAAMDRHKLRRMYVVQYAQLPNPVAALPPVPRYTAASMNTHDMPPFAAHWKGLDISDRAELKILTGQQARQENASRQALRAALMAFLRRRKLVTGRATAGKVWEACAAWLASSRAELVLLNLEDFWQETESQNVPGTFRERPNWRRKARCSLEGITGEKKFDELIARFADLRSRGGISKAKRRVRRKNGQNPRPTPGRNTRGR